MRNNSIYRISFYPPYVRLLPERHVLPIRVYGKIQKNDNKNDI